MKTPTPDLDLNTSIETLSGVGPKTAEILKKAGIKTLRDFFYNLPRDYENYSAPTSIAQVRPGKVVVRGKIEQLTTRRARRRNLTVTEGLIRDKSGAIRVVWFNQGYRARQFSPGKEYFFSGSYELRNGRFSLLSPSAAEVTEIDPSAGLSPIYVAHGRFSSLHYRRLMQKSRALFAKIPDFLPGVPQGQRRDALYEVHFPTTSAAVRKARRYLACEELFELILAARLNRRENERLKAPAIPFDVQKIRSLVAALPFRLTNAQRLAAWEIFQEMEKGVPMNRLLQGDVGSGKTVVAAMSAYEAILQGYQVALLAPTAILAAQHFASLEALLKPFGVKIALLTGATEQKPSLKRQIAAGQVDLVVGTHALITDDTEFRHLALAIIDEQHRFGVEQRQKLVLKSPDGLAPHLLAMTATPIPRSLQLTLFGDLSVSVLGELPRGRQPVTTQIVSENSLQSKVYPKMREILAAGQQIYWICKSIEDSDSSGASSRTSDTTSVKTRAKRLAKEFPDATVAYLHGRLKPDEKDDIMERFSRGEIQILVSTTVVEVGVDVPNANLMVIENAEHYGLAQLHQLRGRVGRGQAAAFCYLLTSGNARPSRRLQELEKSTDGFHLAEVDLELRGPGEIYGALQHGALDLRIASLSDTHLIHRAAEAVDQLLQNPENMLQYKELMGNIAKYQQITTLN